MFEGYVLKRGHLKKNWKQRWLVVGNGEIMYFTDHNKSVLKKKIALSPKVVVHEEGPMQAQNIVFAITFASEELRRAWIDAIRKEVAIMGGGGGGDTGGERGRLGRKNSTNSQDPFSDIPISPSKTAFRGGARSASPPQRPPSSTSAGSDEAAQKDDNAIDGVIFNDASSTLEGYVIKRGHVIANWKSRWLVVGNGEIAYYVDHTKTSLRKKVELGPKVVVQRMPPLDTHKTAFLVSFPHQWDLIMSVASDELVQRWMDFITTEVAAFLPQQPSDKASRPQRPVPSKGQGQGQGQRTQSSATLARAIAKRPVSVTVSQGIAASLAASLMKDVRIFESEQEAGLRSSDSSVDTAPPLPPGWAKALTEDGKVYYHNAVTQESRWDMPTPTPSTPSPASPEPEPEEPEEPAEDTFPHYEQPGAQHDDDVDVDTPVHRIIEECVGTWSTDSKTGRLYPLPALLQNLVTILPAEVLLAIHGSSHAAVLTALPALTVASPAAEVKRAYLMAIRFVHPDKLPADLDPESVYLVRHVFMVLNTQFDAFRRCHRHV